MANTMTAMHKTLWRLSRTPLAPVIKGWMRSRIRSEIELRQRLAEGISFSKLESTLAETLNRDGYCTVTHAMDQKLLAEVAAASAAKYEKGKTQEVKQESTHKDYWTRLLDEDKLDGMLPTDNPYVAFALQPAVLAILSKCLGELPYLDYVLLLLSRNTGKEFAKSQLWHRDYDDLRTIKLYIYLTEVADAADGPFTFLPGPVSDKLGFSLRTHRSDESILANVGASGIKSMVAPRLSVFMVETSRCLHMGSRVAPGHDRLMYMATFISVPRLFPEPPPRFRLTGKESDIQKAVVLPNFIANQ